MANICLFMTKLVYGSGFQKINLLCLWLKNIKNKAYFWFFGLVRLFICQKRKAKSKPKFV